MINNADGPYGRSVVVAVGVALRAQRFFVAWILAAITGSPVLAQLSGPLEGSGATEGAPIGASAPAEPLRSSLSLEERVDCQGAIEAVYWRHRLWPEQNPGPKPALSEVMPFAAIERKAEDVVAMSEVLAGRYHSPIEGAHLQAELDRMAKQSRNSKMLAELFAALGNDPLLAAECLARPVLANRRLRTAYAYDGLEHGPLGQRARDEASASGNSVDTLRAGSAEVTEASILRRKVSHQGNSEAAAPVPGRAIELEPEEWDATVRQLESELAPAGPLTLAHRLTPTGEPSADLPIGRLGPVREEEDRFVAHIVTGRSLDSLDVAAVSWTKRSFDDWWAEVRQGVEVSSSSYRTLQANRPAYVLPLLVTAGCTDDTWQLPPGLSSQVPAGRTGHTAVWTGSEMVVWGGALDDGGLQAVQTGGRYDPALDLWQATSRLSVPSGRTLHRAVWTGTEMIVWGGTNLTTRLNTGGRYNPSTDTWTATSLASAPVGRSTHTAVWTGTQLVIWGGYNGTNRVNSGGRYTPSTNTWSTTNEASAPSARARHTAVWTGVEMVIWGGDDDGSVRLNTGGRYNPSTDSWSSTSLTSVPAARLFHTAVWSGTEMLVWGGDGGGDLASGGRYNPSTDAWSATTMASAPAARDTHVAVWTGSEMVVWGGWNGATMSSGGRYNPSTDSWTATNLPSAPTARYLHSAVWTGTEMIVWGGWTSTYSNTGSRYRPSSDTWLTTRVASAPGPRIGHVAEWTGAEMLIWGGAAFSVGQNNGGRYDPATDSWIATSSVSVPDVDVQGLTSIWTGTEMVFWGGGGTDTGGRYNPTTDSWLTTSQLSAPSPRRFHTAVWTGTDMVVWGGDDESTGVTKTGGRYHLSTDTWLPTSQLSAPSPRSGHTAVWTGSAMVVWGGGDNLGSFNTGGQYFPATDTWMAAGTSLASAPSARGSHSVVWTGSTMVVWGGSSGLGDFVGLNSGGRYNPSTDTWSATSLAGAAGPRLGGSFEAIWTGAEMIVWGGYSNGGYLSTGGRYRPSTDTWKATSISTPPEARYGHTAIWTGVEMIVWGGWHGSGPGEGIGTGGRYCASGEFHDGFETGNTAAWSLASN